MRTRMIRKKKIKENRDRKQMQQSTKNQDRKSRLGFEEYVV